MATNLFTLMATIGIDDSEYNKGIDGAKEKGEGFGSALATVGKGAKVAFEAIGAAAAAVGTAVGATAVQAFNASNQLEATQAKYSTVFGEFSDQSDEFISKFQELTPATKAEAQSMASSFQD